MAGVGRTVPNPRMADLRKLRSDLAKEAEILRKALKGPAEDLGGDRVWVGKNARAWHRELEGRHRKLGKHVGRLLSVIDAAIRIEPEDVPTAEARSYDARS